MPQLDHLIVPSAHREEGAALLSRLLGVPWAAIVGPFGASFASVHVNENLTFDFGVREPTSSQHYCLMVTEVEFDAIFDRIKAEGIEYGSSPREPHNGLVNSMNDGKNIYWTDGDNHLWEILTVSYARPA